MEYRIKQIIIYSILSYILYSAFHIPIARAAVGVSPQNLRFVMDSGERPKTLKIFLQNLDAETGRAQIKVANAALEGLFEVKPAITYLPPRKIVPVEITLKTAVPVKTELAIITEYKDQLKLGLASGIKIPLSVEQPKNSFYLSLILALAAALSTTALTYWKFKKPRTM